MSDPLLTVVIASHSDNLELEETYSSIFKTVGSNKVEVVIVDDCSRMPVAHDRISHCRVKIITTKNRIGVGPARYLGALHANGEYLLFVDSHCRFTPGWYEAAMNRIVDRPSTVHCGSCLGLGYNGSKEMNMNVDAPNATYFGATWNMFGPDRKNPKEIQVFESVWADERPGDDYELSGCMGACYFVPRDWYLNLNCGRNLLSYGCDEQELALKTYLAGGSVRMLKGVRIGHKFRQARKLTVLMPNTYNSTAFVIRNKMFLIQTLLPPDMAEILLSKLRHDREYAEAKRMMNYAWADVEIERERNRRLFTRDFPSFLKHFQLSFPSA